MLHDIRGVFEGGGKLMDDLDLQVAAIAGSLVVAQLRENAEVVGALTLREFTATDAYRLNKYLSLSEKVICDRPTLHLLDLAVADQWRGQGVATELVRRTISDHRYDESMLYSRVFASSCVPRDGGGPSSRGLLLRLGFKELYTEENYYKRLEPTEFACPHCDAYGNGNTCTCLGVHLLFTRPSPAEKIEEEKGIDSIHLPTLT